MPLAAMPTSASTTIYSENQSAYLEIRRTISTMKDIAADLERYNRSDYMMLVKHYIVALNSCKTRTNVMLDEIMNLSFSSLLLSRKFFTDSASGLQISIRKLCLKLWIRLKQS